MGAVLPFSLGKIEAQDRSAAYWRIARRTAMLFFLGLVYNKILQMELAGVSRYLDV